MVLFLKKKKIITFEPYKNCMKKSYYLLFISIISIFLYNCEKDDICASGTPTTPLLVVEFYDAAAPSNTKNVSNLVVATQGSSSGFSFNNVNTVKIPLQTTANSTTFEFTANGADDDTTNNNIDVVTFNYTRENSYVSRACGYKTTFQLDTTTPINLTTDTDNWIQSITVEQSAITTQNETHVKIYF